MRIITKTVPADFNLFLFSCTHWGSTFTHVSGWEQLVDQMNSEYAGLRANRNFGVHHGDIIEGKLIDDPHFAITGSDPGGILPQIELSQKKLWPIRKKLAALLIGNHEWKLRKFGDIGGVIATHLGVPYGTFACKIHYVDKYGGLIFKHFAIHGRKQVGSVVGDIIQRRNNMRVQLKRHLVHEAGDCMLQTKGHTHKLLVAPPIRELYLTDSGTRIQQNYTSAAPNDTFISPDLRWYVNVGAFYRKYATELLHYDIMNPMESVRSSYVEMGEYPPAELGYAVALVRDGNVVDVKLEVAE
uniref:Calcineurin-like phosphoesterase n=1 Tax=viral metagenome TaxID=1070528 RepID=A0A6M3LNJ9_9ZZZZ